ncbi:MAG: hypothetical protein R6V60_08645 [Desulfobacterales bacterium]
MDLPFSPADALPARLRWYLLKLPLTLVLIFVGFLFEAFLGWPFAVLCWLHARRRPC